MVERAQEERSLNCQIWGERRFAFVRLLIVAVRMASGSGAPKVNLPMTPVEPMSCVWVMGSVCPERHVCQGILDV
jgi:hypothetical protein